MIESVQNDKIKYVSRLLSDNRFRKKQQIFAVEGKQENARALTFGYQPLDFYVCDALFHDESPAGTVHRVSEKVYEKIAYRGSSEGIIGIYQTPKTQLTHYQPKGRSAVIVVEGVEKPGNLGAILRSCEAFGIDALIITDPKLDLYNPNVIRSSVGCLFGMQVFQSENEQTLEFLKKHQFDIITTRMHDDAAPLQKRNLTGKSAIIFGTEHSGLSDFWQNEGANTIIPMAGSIDSLNLSNAVAICCYEILRQKLA